MQEGNEQRLTIHIGQTIVNSGVQGDLLHGVDVFIRLLGDPLPPEWNDVNVTGSAYSEWSKENANNQYWFHHDATELYNANITIQVEWSGGVTLNISIPVGWDIGVDVEDDLINTEKVNIHLKGMANWNDVTLVDRETQTLNGWTRKDSGTDHWYEKQDTEAIADETVSIRYQGIEQTSKVVQRGHYSRIITTSDNVIEVKDDIAWLTTQQQTIFSYKEDVTGNDETIERTDIKALYVDAKAVTCNNQDNLFNVFAINCTNLTKFRWIPPEMTLAGINCFCAMFYGCTSLTALPDNFTFSPRGTITKFKGSFAVSSFAECSNLVALPSNFLLPNSANYDTSSDWNDFGFGSNMFYKCSKLETLSDGFTLYFNNWGLIGQNAFLGMFDQCEELKELPINFRMPGYFNFAGSGSYAGAQYCMNMFNKCVKLEHLPSGFTMAGCTSSLKMLFANGMFMGCSELKDIPVNFTLPTSTSNPGATLFKDMFSGCTSLTNNQNPTNLFIPNISTTNYCHNMFNNCPGLALPSPTPSPGDNILISRSQ